MCLTKLTAQSAQVQFSVCTEQRRCDLQSFSTVHCFVTSCALWTPAHPIVCYVTVREGGYFTNNSQTDACGENRGLDIFKNYKLCLHTNTEQRYTFIGNAKNFLVWKHWGRWYRHCPSNNPLNLGCKNFSDVQRQQRFFPSGWIIVLRGSWGVEVYFDAHLVSASSHSKNTLQLDIICIKGPFCSSRVRARLWWRTFQTNKFSFHSIHETIPVYHTICTNSQEKQQLEVAVVLR